MARNDKVIVGVRLEVYQVCFMNCPGLGKITADDVLWLEGWKSFLWTMGTKLGGFLLTMTTGSVEVSLVKVILADIPLGLGRIFSK